MATPVQKARALLYTGAEDQEPNKVEEEEVDLVCECKVEIGCWYVSL
jgi:hypothetical protein